MVDSNVLSKGYWLLSSYYQVRIIGFTMRRVLVLLVLLDCLIRVGGGLLAGWLHGFSDLGA